MHDQPEHRRRREGGGGGEGGEGGRGEDSPKSQAPCRRKLYRTPRLVAYGNLRDITMAKGGLKQDGGPSNPFTKV